MRDMDAVYPGHPVTIAVAIFRAYPSIEKAFEMTVHGCPAALGNGDVPGAGGNAYQGLGLVRKLLDDGDGFDAHVEAGFAAWRRQVTTPVDDVYRDRLGPGNEQARALVEELRGHVLRARGGK